MKISFKLLGAILIGLVVSSTVFCYKIEVKNGTDEEIIGTVHYSYFYHFKVCSEHTFHLNVRPGYFTIQTGACCPSFVTFKGKGTGLEGKYFTKKGLGYGCRNQKFEILKSPKGLYGEHR